MNFDGSTPKSGPSVRINKSLIATINNQTKVTFDRYGYKRNVAMGCATSAQLHA